MDQASRAHFGAPLGYIGQGGTIPLMNLLQQGFPQAQMMVCGVLGPKSNAHGPNEFLHIPTGKRVTSVVAKVIGDHYEASEQGLTRGVGVHAGHANFGDHGCC